MSFCLSLILILFKLFASKNCVLYAAAVCFRCFISFYSFVWVVLVNSLIDVIRFCFGVGWYWCTLQLSKWIIFYSFCRVSVCGAMRPFVFYADWIPKTLLPTFCALLQVFAFLQHGPFSIYRIWHATGIGKMNNKFRANKSVFVRSSCRITLTIALTKAPTESIANYLHLFRFL